MLKSEIIPVIAPIGVGPKGETYNINADTVAGAVAGAIKAERLILLTDVEGVLDQDKKLISRLTASRSAGPDPERHHFRRHDPQNRDRHRGGGKRRQCGGHSRRAHSPCAAARTFHRAWRRNPDHRGMRGAHPWQPWRAGAIRRRLTPAKAALKLCNRTSYILYAATASMIQALRTTTQGWTRIAPGDCQTRMPEKLTAQAYLVYARSSLAIRGRARLGWRFPSASRTATSLCGQGVTRALAPAMTFSAALRRHRHPGRPDWTMTFDEQPRFNSLEAAQLAGVKRLLKDNGYPGRRDRRQTRQGHRDRAE